MFFNSESIAKTKETSTKKNSTEANIKRWLKNSIWHDYQTDLIKKTNKKKRKTLQYLIVESFSSHTGNIFAYTLPLTKEYIKNLNTVLNIHSRPEAKLV